MRDDVPPDPLTALADQLEGLGEQPVATHPEVLEGVHRALVAELDALAGAGSPAREA